MENGESYEEALKYCQSIGVAERDPTNDVDGWDAAIKTAALVTVLMNIPMTPQQVNPSGIRGITFATFSAKPVDLGMAEEKLPSKSLSQVDSEIESMLARLQAIEAEYATLAEDPGALEKAEAEITDLLEYQRTLMNARPELGDRVFVLQCWSPVTEEELVGKLGDTFTFYHYSEEPEEWDRMPVLLKNPPAFDSGEDLVKIYSYPSHKVFDPSPFVLCCFAVFFGMIIGDLGYGLILLGMTFWLTRKVKSRSPLAVRMFRLMYLLCASVIFFGFIGAGFFGIQLDPSNPWVKHAWFDYSTTGAEVYPPQPMVGQTRYVLEQYTANGGSFEEVVIADDDIESAIPCRSQFRVRIAPGVDGDQDADTALHGMGAAKDVVVVTPEEMDAQKDLAGSIVRPAFLEGRVLYDRTARARLEASGPA